MLESDPDAFADRVVLYKAGRDDTSAYREAAANYGYGVGFTDFFYAENGTFVFTTPAGQIVQALPAPPVPEPEPAPEPAAAPEPEPGPELTPEPGSEPEPSPGPVPVPDEGGGEAPLPPTADGSAAPEPFGREPEAPIAGRGGRPVTATDTFAMESALEAGALLHQSLYLTPGGQGPAPDGAGPLMLDTLAHIQTKLFNFSYDGKNKIYFMDLEKEGLYSLDLESGLIAPVIADWSGLRLAGGGGLQPYDLKNLRFRDDGHFTATLTRDRETSALAVFENGAGHIFSAFTRTSEDLWRRGLLWSGAFILGFLLLYIAKEVFLIVTRGRVPIVTKMIAVFIPVVVVGLLILQNMMSSLSIRRLVENQYKELYLVSRQQVGVISAKRLKDIPPEDPFIEPYYYSLRYLLTEMPSESKLAGPGKGESQMVYHFSYNWLHRVEDGRLYSLYCDQNYVNVPIEYFYDRDTTAMYYEALGTKQVHRGDFRDIFGEWIVLAVPIIDAETQEVAAILETGITKTALEYMVAASTEQIRNMILGVMAVLVLLLSAILIRSLAPLKELKDKVQEIINGQRGVQARVRGRDEVAEIGRAFNQMSTSIEYKEKELTDEKNGYFRFVPSKMFQILRKSSVVDVRLGDQTQGAITILSFNAADFDRMARTMTGEEMFRQINSLFSNLVPVVNDNEGVVDKFVDAGLVAFFTNGSEQALRTAVSVCQTMDLMNAWQGSGKERRIEITHGISHGPVMIGIVGHQERLAATAISEHTNLSDYLRAIAPRYSARILATASVVNNIEDFDGKYNARFIGFLKKQAAGGTEKLYDVFDGDQEETKLFKKQTKDLFERGVGLYCARAFYEARLVFIEVLKRFRGDGAAKEYLLRCDEYYQRKDTQDIPIEIEVY
jgi:class 3 adenylate cyclase/HAMP domain-containing protein